MIEIHPKEVMGSWDQGYVLDVHTISSTMIGHNEFGHPEFDTVRSQLGELVYLVKYKGDKAVIRPIVETIVGFVDGWGIHPDVIVPVPPSNLRRTFQPVIELARDLAESLKIRLNTTSLTKTKTTQQMKDVGDLSARVATLEAAFTSDRGLEGKVVLLFDDLFQSGATMNVAARTLKGRGLVKSVYALALTRTRN
ncbi:MAG: phosphoribosyltransferase family protein [Candidatus Acidiferrales bacterium]